ncbi:hypothetical protein ACHAWF_014871 [Thalassiosira exigua]
MDKAEPVWADKAWLETIVVVGISCFILCLMNLSKVPTAKMGMIYGMIGMLALIFGFWFDLAYTFGSGRWLIAASMAPGFVLGLASALKSTIVGLPVLVGAYNGFGGLAAALEGIGMYLDPNATNFVRHGDILSSQTRAMLWVQAIAMILSIVIGSMTFTGSLVAVLKLHGTIASKPRVVPFRWLITFIFAVGIIVFSALAFNAGQTWNDRQEGIAFIVIVAVIACIWGFTAVMAIGGGDMPVSISFLNSLSGFSTSAAGFMLINKTLVVSGAFVGCSGIILTLVMCRAMNRSIVNVLVGGFGDGASKVAAQKSKAEGTVTEIQSDEVANLLLGAKSVIIVPGYGMAVAKASPAFNCRSDEDAALKRFQGAVRYSSCGRTYARAHECGKLLAEARVPYDIIFSMDDINSDFPETDVVLIIGANDTVNPAAQTDPDCPIAGMPVLEVWKAKKTIVCKRSLRVGYAGVDNPLFLKPNNAMYLGDAKNSADKLVDHIRKHTAEALESSHSKAKTGHCNSAVAIDIETPAIPMQSPIDDFTALIPKLQEEAFVTVGVGNEMDGAEKRVAIVPDTAKKLLEKGIHIQIESGAGLGAGFSDASYLQNGATILPTIADVYNSSDVIIKISKEPSLHEIGMAKGKTIISFVWPRTDAGKYLMDQAAKQGVNLLSVDAIPRISRAQSLDVLSSQAKIAGYRAVVEASNIYQRFLNGEVTAAGKFDACKVMVVGAGVAGLAAIGTAASMGAIVYAFDTRLETKDEVESMGGTFLVLDFDEKDDGGNSSGYAKVMSEDFYKKEMELFREQAKACQIIITTAAIPGRPAPKLIMKDAVDNMQAGSVIVDLAGATGGNCELTRPGDTYLYDSRVTIIGSTDLVSRMSWQASSMFSNNMSNLLSLLCPDPPKESDKKKELLINMDDQVIRGMTVVLDGAITWPPPESVGQTSAVPKKQQQELATANSPTIGQSKKASILSKRVFDLTTIGELSILAFMVFFFGIVAAFASAMFVSQMLYFILAGFLGYYLIWSVEPALFSPLMSTSNSLSGVVILGGMLMASVPQGSATNVLGCAAIGVAAINVFGGFAVSYRMLLMFKKEK